MQRSRIKLVHRPHGTRRVRSEPAWAPPAKLLAFCTNDTNKILARIVRRLTPLATQVFGPRVESKLTSEQSYDLDVNIRKRRLADTG